MDPVNTNHLKSGDTQQNYRKIDKAKTRLGIACKPDAGAVQLLCKRCPGTNEVREFDT
jgi:hypothetical protein